MLRPDLGISAPQGLGTVSDGRKLLVLGPSYPFPPRDGAQLRLTSLVEGLHPGIEVTLICPDDVEQETETRPAEGNVGRAIRVPRPPRVTGWAASTAAQLLRPDPSLIWKFRSAEFGRCVAREAAAADAVLAVGLQLALYFEFVPPGIPTALDNYNVESRILERLAATRSGLRRRFWLAEAWKLRRWERRLMERSGTVFAISETDREGMSRLAPRANLLTVPMGMHGSSYAGPPSGPPVVLFTGAFNWHVNEDAAVWMCREVWPLIRSRRPDALLRLVGRDPSSVVRELAEPGSVEVTGTVPEMRPYVEAATLIVVPLRYGSGVRTKILEAFTAGRPVISTAVGCEGLDVTHGKELMIGDGSGGFAEACLEVMQDADLAQRLVAAGRIFVERQDREAASAWHRALKTCFRWDAPSG